MKMNCFNKKAQTLTELATFGSILLLVSSFLIRMGLIYNYQQEAQMQAFRGALRIAYDNPHSGANPSDTFTLIKDIHTPDPRDTFGIGQTVPVSGTATATWTNEAAEDIVYGDSMHLPRIFYEINPQSPPPIHARIYTLADYKEYGWLGNMEVTIWDPVKKEFVIIEIPQNRTKVGVFEDPVTLKKSREIIVLLSEDPSDPLYHDKEIINNADVDRDGDPNDDGWKEYTDELIVEPKGADWDVVTGFKVVDFQEGEINIDMTNFENISDVEDLQGLLPDRDVAIKRDDTLSLVESSGKLTSSSKINSTETVTHKIRKNLGIVDTFTNTFQRK